ncbi:MAG: chemotaxis protein CheW [Pseudomonadota bacterium]
MDILEIRRRAKARQEHKGPTPGSEPRTDSTAKADAAARGTPSARAAEEPLAARAVGTSAPSRPAPVSAQNKPAAAAPATSREVPRSKVAEPPRVEVQAVTDEEEDEHILAEFFASERDAAINRFADPTLFSSARVFGRVSPDSTRYLTCRVGSEEYGVELSRTREILKPLKLTPVPRAPAEVLGVISLRGQVLPVVDLTQRLGGQATPQPLRTERYVVLQLQGDLLCIRVDAVSGVVGFGAAEIEPPPKKVRGLDSDAVAGIGRIDERMIILLRIEELVHALFNDHGGVA